MILFLTLTISLSFLSSIYFSPSFHQNPFPNSSPSQTFHVTQFFFFDVRFNYVIQETATSLN